MADSLINRKFSTVTANKDVMKPIISKYLLSGLILIGLLSLLSSCKANKCDCPNFHGKAAVEQVEQC